jgi:hypothetical protein
MAKAPPGGRARAAGPTVGRRGCGARRAGPRPWRSRVVASSSSGRPTPRSQNARRMRAAQVQLRGGGPAGPRRQPRCHPTIAHDLGRQHAWEVVTFYRESEAGHRSLPLAPAVRPDCTRQAHGPAEYRRSTVLRALGRDDGRPARLDDRCGGVRRPDTVCPPVVSLPFATLQELRALLDAVTLTRQIPPVRQRPRSRAAMRHIPSSSTTQIQLFAPAAEGALRIELERGPAPGVAPRRGRTAPTRRGPRLRHDPEEKA